MSATLDSHRNGNDPELSVILVIGGQRNRSARALQSVLDQSIIDRIEILLFDLGPENLSPLPGSDHPQVRLFRWNPKSLLHHARVEGVRIARAPTVLFLEEHCEIGPEAAGLLIEAHRGPWAAVGGRLVNGNPDIGTSNQAFHMNYGRYVCAPQTRGPVRRVSGQNSTFKRDVLLRYNDEIEVMMVSDLILQLMLEKDGYQFFHEPGATVAHRNEISLPSLAKGVFFWNWCFSGTRARLFHWSWLRRIIWILLSPLMPWVRLFRIFRWMLRHRVYPLGKVLRDTPFILVTNYISAVGQVAGLVSGTGYAARRFSEFEMNEPRPSLTDVAT